MDKLLRNNGQIRTLIADDHQILRAGLRALLRGESEIEVVAEAEDGRTAVKRAAEVSPDVVVMDINMPDLNGIEATRQIRAAAGGAKVVALSAHSHRRFVTEMLKAGASAFVLKESAFQELAEAIRAVAQGKVYLSPGVAGEVVDDAVNGSAAGSGEGQSVFSRLSPREREVLQLMAEGKATKQVAMVLHVSVKTAETHRRNLMEKLNIDSVAELTKYALREGITSLET